MPSLSTIYHILPDELIVCEGQQVVLDLNNKIWPQPCIQWQVQVPRPQKGQVQVPRPQKGQVQAPRSKEWVNLRNQTQPVLSFIAQANQNGNKYRALVKPKCGCWETNSTKLTVNFLSIIQQPTNQTSCGSSVTFTALAEGRPVPTVQWQVSTDGATWIDIPGANSTSYTFTPTVDDFGNLYRAVFSNNCTTVTSNSAELLVGCQPIYTVEASLGFPPSGEGYTVVTGVQPIILNIVAPTSACLISKAYPGAPIQSGNFTYDAYTFTQGVRGSCVSITLTGDEAQIFGSAYSPSYDPGNLEPGYLGDAGVFVSSVTFSVFVPANTPLVVVINDVDDNTPDVDYTISVSGLSCYAGSPTAPCPLGL